MNNYLEAMGILATTVLIVLLLKGLLSIIIYVIDYFDTHTKIKEQLKNLSDAHDWMSKENGKRLYRLEKYLQEHHEGFDIKSDPYADGYIGACGSNRPSNIFFKTPIKIKKKTKKGKKK